MQTHALSWFEIPVDDLDRASSFYTAVLNHDLQRRSMGEEELAVFEYAQGNGTGGCLIKSETSEPTQRSSLVYLFSGEDLEKVLERVWNAGGTVVEGKTALPPGMGYYAHIIDSEGNRVGLHSYS